MNDHVDDQRFEEARAAANRRAVYRLPIALDVLVEVPLETRGCEDWERGAEGPLLETVTEDLSVQGLRFRAPKRLERETPVEVALVVEGKRLVLTGAVAQSTVDSFGAGIGLRFTDAEAHPAQSLLSRFLFARERRRLPQVPVMYAVRCSEEESRSVIEGTTEECSPGFAWILLTKPMPPGLRVLVKVTVDNTELAIRGRAVGSSKISDLWRTGVEFDEILPRWRDVMIERRDGWR